MDKRWMRKGGEKREEPASHTAASVKERSKGWKEKKAKDIAYCIVVGFLLLLFMSLFKEWFSTKILD